MSPSLTDRLVVQLRAAILSGRIAPGSIVVEPRLAEEYSVSKTPVREALRLLTSQGLLTVLPKKGYLVRTMGLHDVQETLDLRMLLEPHAAAAAAGFLPQELTVKLRQLLDAQAALSAADPLGAMKAAQDFHQAIADASRNSRLADSLRRCFDETARAHHVLPGLQHYMGAPTELAEHEAIYAAIAAADARAAEEAMRVHLRSIRTAMAQQFTDPGSLWA
ncbi:GntR family transcriptional regulator [Paeniglutamicibacter sulfureus]|uniref:GntR family transcriptional regulator n=1 Tax=Paeniglutamicibacter sulfureus TaxID=43666 RepID=UPI0026653F11|nr:GntR family transcriptional regulator [Paeniglutamicibacter sulfureus]MDO2934458.1 GntR family transcriptional regulator [Paeniglutamicibacter sulfureus]